MRIQAFYCVLVAVCAAFIPASSLADGTAVGQDLAEASQFDFWIGEWDVLNKTLGEDGWAESGQAAVKVYPVLGGRALVEHWRGTAWGGKTIGFSVRSFDEQSGKWFLLLSWPGKDKPGFGTLEGDFTHGRGEFFQDRKTPEGEPLRVRYSFSDIKPNALRWDAAKSTDGGSSWLTYWIMELTRRAPDAPPLFHGPWVADGRDRHCGQPEAAQLDALAGGYKGVEKRREANGSWSERPARATIYPILEGCAQMDLIEVLGEGAYQRFAIRAWGSREGRWKQYEMETYEMETHEMETYEMETRAPRFVHTAGQAVGDRIELTPDSGEGEPVRVVWSWRGDGSLVREDARSEDQGATWETVRRLELEPSFYGDLEEPRP